MVNAKFNIITTAMVLIGMVIMFVANMLAGYLNLPADFTMLMGQTGGLLVLIGTALFVGYTFGQARRY